MRTFLTLFSALTILLSIVAAPAAAKEDTLEFIHLLQKEGYSDVAVEYLNQIKADPLAPKAIMDVWDLEMSRSMKGAAKQAYSDAQAKKLTEESKALLERFIKANPSLPEAVQEAAKWAEEKAMQAQYTVLRAGYATDKAEKEKLLAEARKMFEDVRPQFVDAEKASAKILASLPARASARQRENAIYMAGENRLTVAMVDFYLAETLPAGPARNDALTKTGKEFDSIFQDFREVFLGTRAHFWSGRICQEMDQVSDAKAIYEEVAAYDDKNIADVNDNKLASAAKSRRKTGTEEFFADNEQYLLQTMFQLGSKDYKDYLEEVQTWRAAHKGSSEACYGYQALTFELAKNLQAIGEKRDAATKDKLKHEALKLLDEMAKISSPYQESAAKLRRQLNPNGTPEQGFEDAVIDGDAALEKRKWEQAVECYKKAVASAGPKTDQAKLTAVKNTLVACYHNLALQLYQQGKIDDAITTAKEALKKPFLNTKAAPGVGVFLLNVLYYQYQAAPEKNDAEKKAKAELFTKVSNTAKSILNIQDWAAKQEGDAARIVLLRLALSQEKMSEADKVLAEINPNSREYPKALTVMGFAHWFKYKTAKKTLEKTQDADKAKIAQRDEHRKLALDYIERAVKALDTPRAEGEPVPDSLRESQMLLADIYLEAEDYKRADAIYRSLVDLIVKDPDKPFDDTAIRIFSGAGLACLKLSDVAYTTMVGNKFLELGPDQPQVNLALLNFARQLDNARKSAIAENDSADQTAQATTAQASTAQASIAEKLKALTELQQKVMINLSTREKIGAGSMIWIVKTSAALGTDDAKTAAANLIKKIFDRADNDNAFQSEIEKMKAAVPLHAMGATLLADLGKYKDAKDQIDEMIQKFPRALEPQLRKAEILTKWAGKDATKYAEAIGVWDVLRTKLERISAASPPSTRNGTVRIDPKYEVIASEADCFYHMAVQKGNNKEEAKKGFELVGPYLNLDPNIRAPSDEYKEISVRFYQVGGKLADVLGVPRPRRPAVKRPAL